MMGFATADKVEPFCNGVSDFERKLVRFGIRLLKRGISITDEEQRRRCLMRVHDPRKQRNLSPIDLESRIWWEDCTMTKGDMLQRTNIPEASWYAVEAVDKIRARLYCIDHLLGLEPYKAVPHGNGALHKCVFNPNYERSAIERAHNLPRKY